MEVDRVKSIREAEEKGESHAARERHQILSKD